MPDGAAIVPSNPNCELPTFAAVSVVSSEYQPVRFASWWNVMLSAGSPVVSAFTETGSVAMSVAESEIVKEHVPNASGVTVMPFSVELIAPLATPVQPETE